MEEKEAKVLNDGVMLRSEVQRLLTGWIARVAEVHQVAWPTAVELALSFVVLPAVIRPPYPPCPICQQSVEATDPWFEFGVHRVCLERRLRGRAGQVERARVIASALPADLSVQVREDRVAAILELLNPQREANVEEQVLRVLRRLLLNPSEVSAPGEVPALPPATQPTPPLDPTPSEGNASGVDERHQAVPALPPATQPTPPLDPTPSEVETVPVSAPTVRDPVSTILNDLKARHPSAETVRQWAGRLMVELEQPGAMVSATAKLRELCTARIRRESHANASWWEQLVQASIFPEQMAHSLLTVHLGGYFNDTVDKACWPRFWVKPWLIWDRILQRAAQQPTGPYATAALLLDEIHETNPTVVAIRPHTVNRVVQTLTSRGRLLPLTPPAQPLSQWRGLYATSANAGSAVEALVIRASRRVHYDELLRVCGAPTRWVGPSLHRMTEVARVWAPGVRRSDVPPVVAADALCTQWSLKGRWADPEFQLNGRDIPSPHQLRVWGPSVAVWTYELILRGLLDTQDESNHG